jgi:hypothetical protein
MSNLFADFELPVAATVSPLKALVDVQGITTPRADIGAGGGGLSVVLRL